MWVYAKELHTKRLNAVPGFPVEQRLNSPIGRAYLKKTFGKDSIVEIEPGRPEEYLKLLGAHSDEDVKVKYGQLKLLADEQAERIKVLERENEILKKQQLRKQRPAQGEDSNAS